MIEKTEKEIMENWETYEKPLVSICFITFNHEKFITMSLDSILIQETNFPFEIIIRDDCSTDNTATIVREYAEKFPHIISTILETENQFSKGVNPFFPIYDIALGKYVAILEGDDYWRDDSKLQKQVDFLNKNKNYVLSYNNSIVVDENNQLLRKIRNPLSKDYTRDQMLCGEVTISTNTVMFRKVDLTQINENMDNVSGMDIVLWHLLGQHGESKYQDEITPAAYREHSGGVWSSLDYAKKLEHYIVTRQRLKKIAHGDSKIKVKIDKSIDKIAAVHLYQSITSFEFKSLQNIVKFITDNKDLSLFKSVVLLPIVFLKRIKRKIS